MTTCDRCHNLCTEPGFRFERHYRPDEWLEGYRSSPVWIIGLNPGMKIGWQDDKKDVTELEQFFAQHAASTAYFRQFRQVSQRLYEKMGQPDGVAHTDIVKCASKSWPPGGASKNDTEQIVQNCGEFMKKQIEHHKPKVLICNGASVCSMMQQLFPPSNAEEFARATSYHWQSGDHRIAIVLSGFIGRIDNYARRRLGREIERLVADAGIEW